METACGRIALRLTETVSSKKLGSISCIIGITVATSKHSPGAMYGVFFLPAFFIEDLYVCDYTHKHQARLHEGKYCRFT